MFGMFRNNGKQVKEILEDRMDGLRAKLESAYLDRDLAFTELINLRSNIESNKADKQEDFAREKRELGLSFEEKIRSLESKILALENRISIERGNHENELGKLKADTEVNQITYKARVRQELADKFEDENNNLKETIQEVTADRSNYHGLYEGALLVIQTLEEQLAGQNELISALIAKTPGVNVNVSTPTTIAGQIVEKNK